ncbi:L-threonylcarbamoyladenylate synthase, partial [Patescibacteria group bacterium]
MKIVKLKSRNISSHELGLIIRYFKLGKVIAYPTDTIYGLGCRADNKKVIEKIYR